MDFIWILLLMALLYGVPELLRKKQGKTYEYPQIPDPQAPSSEPPDKSISDYEVTVSRPTAHLLSELSEQEPFAPMSVAAPAISLDEKPTFDSRQVVTGIVWAEILDKPKIVRPYLPRKVC